jgi:putative protease
MFDAFAKIQRMAKQKFRPTRPGGFSGAKAYIRYVEVLENRRNAVGRTFCDAIMFPIRIAAAMNSSVGFLFRQVSR